MSKKKEPVLSNHEASPTKDSRNYEFHSDAVDHLVDAHAGHAKAYSEKDLRQYRTRKGISLAQWLKIILLKAWFAGMVCYFILWGLGVYVSATLDVLVIVGIVLGLVTDLLLNNLLRFMEERPNANNRWMMFPPRRVVSLILNVLYSCIILMCVYSVYTGVNAAGAARSGNPNDIILGVEPILFGLMYMGFDMLFIAIKQMFIKILRDARSKVDRSI